jgi:ribosomal RNA-processing protein 9
VSSDGKWLAVGGGDRQVHVFDAGSGQHVAAYPGHRDIISGLAFREGTHTLYSASYDRTVKIWSLENSMYVDTLFGHQAEVYAVDALRAERAVSSGHDHTCRVWKVPEESQLIFRAPSMSVQCCRWVVRGGGLMRGVGVERVIRGVGGGR